MPLSPYTHRVIFLNGGQCAAADPTSLQLLEYLAARSPLSFCRSGTPEGIVSLFTSAISSLQNPCTDARYVKCVEALLGAVCEVGNSFETSEKAISKNKGGNVNELLFLLQVQ
eukprot:4755651-Ditylum_brightwellii.AAC.1